MGFLMYDWKYLLLVLLPGLLIGLWAQARVHAAFRRASRIRNRRGMTGAEAAQAILEDCGIRGVEIEPTEGFLSDHYHPLLRKLRLSRDVYEGDSLAAVGIAAHEAGHAVQHGRGYLPLLLRSALVPVSSAGMMLAEIAIFMGLLLLAASPALGRTLLFFAVLGYGAFFLFTLVTLPVEINASSRALAALTEGGIVSADELPEVRGVLGAAALTYVAAAVTALLNLLYVLLLFLRARER